MQQSYDKHAHRYDRMLAPIERHYLAKLRRETLGLLPDNGTILEIGAGTGANFKFYPRCKRAIASEISFNMIEIAKGRSAFISLVQADGQDLPFPANHFDAAFATLVFCSIPKPEKALAEIIRVLKPGGRLILLEHVRPTGLLGPVFDLLNFVTVALIEDHFNRRTADLVRAGGFQNVTEKRYLAGILNLIVGEIKTQGS
ncbi:MAG TPA: class I SAM-dependent methyltransferase [Pyrinomonadaceae bacterium]|nr:methyltransferase domain-containing protein [Acidobacteriota bacterium]HQZ96681.1 class I SAM-dependent methyltransferase [Pyrinomonadaceae bacterium]HRA41894.1 class I SAM-dependent methyltransferase [Pyrinomonadaceae bacterium]